MGFSTLSLLVHHDGVPIEARDALRAASSAPAAHRELALEHAARVLYRETELDCVDVRELVGLSPGSCG